MKAPLAALLLALPAAALAHPHPTEADTPKAEKRWLFLGDKAETKEESDATGGRVVIRMEEDGEGVESVETFRWNGEELTDMARELETAIAESGVLSDMASLLSEFAQDIEVERGPDSGTALKFDGQEMLRFRLDRERDVDDALSITGLGRNLTVERDTVVRDGKTRTRIVIEMDGGEDLALDLPERD